MIKYCSFCGRVCDMDDLKCGYCGLMRFFSLDEVIRMVIRKQSGIDEK